MSYLYKSSLLWLRPMILTRGNIPACSHHIKRLCSSEGNDTTTPPEKKLELMKFPFITWPSAFHTIRNLIYAALFIKPFYDSDFGLRSFTNASKHVLVKVSEELSKGNFEYLKQFVDPTALEEIKDNFANLTLRQRQILAVKYEDIYFCFPYQLGLIYKGSSDQRVFAEITMCYHMLQGHGNNPREFRPRNAQEVGDKFTIANYRFIREITKGTENQWTINVLNHYVPLEHGPHGPSRSSKEE